MALPRTFLAAAAFAGVLGFGGAASAAPESLREGLFGAHPEGREMVGPPVARYVSETGETFVLDRTQKRPLLKFENSFEVLVLQAHAAPRGDVIYKNDLGEPVLRATRLGGVTVFTDGRPAGSAAALTGGGAPLRLTPIGPQALGERLLQASVRAGRMARHAVVFQAEASPASSALIGDTAVIAVLAVARLAEQPQGRGRLVNLRRVFMEEGRKVAAQLRQGTLYITVVPGLGLAGRPSSDRLVQAVSEGR